MATQKLTNSKREYIVQKLLKPYLEKEAQLRQHCIDGISQIYNMHVPKELLVVYEKFPESLAPAALHIAGYYWGVKAPRFDFVNTNGEVISFEDIIKGTDDWKKIKAHIDTYHKVLQDNRTLRNKLHCALSHIITYPQCKREFPEAYDVLLTYDTGASTDVACDSIESVRAQLSKQIK